jgi:hypothetical protein
MKSVGALLAGASPETAVYTNLQAPAPKALAGHAAGRRPRSLSDKQRDTFLGTAAARVTAEASTREGRWLRRLDTIHKSGCRTKQQRWNALAAMAEPMLARMDIATLCLGYLDSTGAFRLNRQRGLAHDGGLSECSVSRTLAALETARYVKRKLRRIYYQGRAWVTRVTIHIRPQFFIDLGLGHLLADARTKKKATRAKKLRHIGAEQQQQAIQELADKQMRRESHKKAEGARRVREEEQTKVASLATARARAETWTRLIEQNPTASPTALRAMLDKLHPPA